MTRTPWRRLGAALLTLLLAAAVAGCVTAPRTSLQADWTNPQLAGTKFSKIIIVTVSDLEFGQKIFQDQLAARLQAAGVNAVASGRFFSSTGPAQREALRGIIANAKADGVIFARSVNTETVKQQQADIAGGVPLATTVGLYDVWTGIGIGVAGVGWVAAPSAVVSTSTTTDVYLFEVKGEKLVWSARMNTTNRARMNTTNSDQGNLTPVVTQVVNTVVDTMKRDRVL
ncbi:MAG: hypothetical protein MUF79_12010 [Burkholderiales bacterium]|nr:hypothetical protein [Burkholderiales bacterium]